MTTIELTPEMICPGLLVNYRGENGIIKSSNKGTPFVVYKCGGKWEDFQNYTGQATPLKDLEIGWIPKHQGQTWMNSCDIVRRVPGKGVCYMQEDQTKEGRGKVVTIEHRQAFVYETLEEAAEAICRWQGTHKPPGELLFTRSW